jgi:hypothetical protein
MEYKTMRRLSPTLKKMLEGLAYADLGEMLLQSAKDEVLTGRTSVERTAVPAPAPMADAPAVPSGKRVGLFLGPYATRAVVDYALESCARMHAELVVFTFMDDKRAHHLLEDRLPAASGPAPTTRVQHLSGDPEKALECLQGRGVRLEFLVCDEQGYLGHRILAGDTSLDIPVVMVAPSRESGPSRSAEPPPSAAPARS